MVYAPNHFQDVHQPRVRGTRERRAVQFFALVTIIVVGLMAYSLTDRQRQTKNGCIDFNYTTMIGGAETYKCGAQAKTLCLTPETKDGIDGDFQTGLFAACRKAGLPLDTARATSPSQTSSG